MGKLRKLTTWSEIPYSCKSGKVKAGLIVLQSCVFCAIVMIMLWAPFEKYNFAFGACSRNFHCPSFLVID